MEQFSIIDYATIITQDGSELNVVVVDLGLGGLQLRSKNPIPLEICTITVKSVLPLKVKGEIRYSRITDESELYSSGFKFLPNGYEDRVDIAKYVHSIFERNLTN